MEERAIVEPDVFEIGSEQLSHSIRAKSLEDSREFMSRCPMYNRGERKERKSSNSRTFPCPFFLRIVSLMPVTRSNCDMCDISSYPTLTLSTFIPLAICILHC